MPFPIIELDGLHKHYDGGDVAVHAVRGVTFTIARGEMVAIMGVSGSGKSTLMHMLGCLDRPTQGRYVLDGVDVGSLTRDELAVLRNRKLGFVFQGFNLLPRTTALENVELPMLCSDRKVSDSEARNRAQRCLTQVGLADRSAHFPNQLSGGQQQRVAIARALANEPQVILADEPTGNLDSRATVEIMSIFQQLNEAGMTIVMVTHDPEIARYCKRILVVRDGKLVRDELVRERLEADRERRKMLTDDADAQLAAG